MNWDELKRRLEKICGWSGKKEPVKSIEIPRHAKDLLSWQRRLKSMMLGGKRNRKELKKRYKQRLTESQRHMYRKLFGPSFIDGIGPKWLR